MRTEDLLRYQRMYAAMRQALGTPWLTFEHIESQNSSANFSVCESDQQRLSEPGPTAAFQTPNESGSDL